MVGKESAKCSRADESLNSLIGKEDEGLVQECTDMHASKRIMCMPGTRDLLDGKFLASLVFRV